MYREIPATRFFEMQVTRMAVFRVARKGNYTVMSNYHLKDRRLSLKAKGLLSQMLSLPDDWDYTLSGLAHINKEGRDTIRTAIRELESAGYITRQQTVEPNGKFGTNEYTIYEIPQDVPLPVKPLPNQPSADNTTQLNTNQTSTDRQKKDSIHFGGRLKKSEHSATKGHPSSAVLDTEKCREVIHKNIEYESLSQRAGEYQEELNEIVELIVETICSDRTSTHVAGCDFPQEIVRDRLMGLRSDHIRFVMSCMQENTSKVRNMKKYLLTALFNAPVTISNYYNSLANHNLKQGS